MLALNMWISGFFRFGEIGRTRPQLGGQAAAVNAAGGGKVWALKATHSGLPAFAGTVQSGTETLLVRRLIPSKFKESRTTLLKASMVFSAADALNSVPFRISQVKPRRGCQLLWSDEQAGMIPFPWKHVPLGPFTLPPLNAPASRS